MTYTAIKTGVRCGNHSEPTYHPSVDEVRACHSAGFIVAYTDYLSGRTDAVPTEPAKDQIYLVDVAEGRATIEEYAAARGDLSPEERQKALDSYYKIGRKPSGNFAGVIAEHRPASEGPAVKDGIYRNPATGQIFKVYRTVHGAHQTVAKELIVLPEADWFTKMVRGKQITVKAQFEYRGKAGLRGLTAGMRMSLEEGKKYGAVYGVCVRCAATLTREESIERAMGLVCAGKANWRD